MGILTVEVKVTDLPIVQEMIEELAYLKYFYAESDHFFEIWPSRVKNLIRAEYISKGNKLPEGY